MLLNCQNFSDECDNQERLYEKDEQSNDFQKNKKEPHLSAVESTCWMLKAFVSCVILFVDSVINHLRLLFVSKKIEEKFILEDSAALSLNCTNK